VALLGGACLLAASSGAAYEPTANSFVGKWERRVTDGGTVTMTFEANRAHICVEERSGKKVTIHADYGVTKDNVIFGVVTSVEAPDDDKAIDMMDTPFSMQARVDEGALILRLVRDKDRTELNDLAPGRYKRVGEPAKKEPLLAY
jgi:hypothetical protein